MNKSVSDITRRDPKPADIGAAYGRLIARWSLNKRLQSFAAVAVLTAAMAGCSDLDLGPLPANNISPGDPRVSAVIPSGPDTTAAPAASQPQTQPGPAAATQASDEPAPLVLTVEDAIFTALQNNPNLQLQRLTVPIQREGEQQQLAAFDPTVSASVQAGKTNTPITTIPPPSQFTDTIQASAAVSQFFPTGTTVALNAGTTYNNYEFYSDSLTATNVGMTVTQALLQGFGTDVNLAQLREAQLDTKISQYELRGFAETLVANIEDTYWDYALAQRQIVIFTNSLAVAQKQAYQTSEFISAGKLAETERAAAEAEVALRREDLINARATLETTRLHLLQLISPKDKNFWRRSIELKNDPFVPQGKLDDVEAHANVALKLRPDLNQARLQIQRGDLEVVRTKNGVLPQLNVFITLGKTGYSKSFGGSVTGLDGDGYNALVGLNFVDNVGNRAANAQYHVAKLSREQQIDSLQNLIDLAQVDVRSGYMEVVRTREQIAATTATRILQEEKLRAESEKFRVGRSTSILVAQAQRDLLSSQIDEIQAVVGNIKALVNLYQLEGSLLVRRRIAAPGTQPVHLPT
jgi:outer membrane protein TolC